MPIRLVLVLSLILASFGAAQASLAEYLPDGVEYDAAIPKPAEVLGWEVGEWHVRHDKLVEYMEAVAAASDRVSLEVYGRTHEQRPLVMLTITAPGRFASLDDVRRRHLASCDGGDTEVEVGGMPVVTQLGYSVHGNESSGANAAMLVAYHLAAARGREIDALLGDSVILLDPCLNPDGLARFASWANMHRGTRLVGDPRHREHREGWPSGRTNHYWFDLNRDWLLLEHPESRARVEQFHRWRPNVVADFHEMGSNNTFFFQPGVPERRNPLTPRRNVELTEAIGELHKEALDARGQLWFTRELYDDFYYGKGSTYPDVHGAVGILFEQASARGHVQETRNGTLTFPVTIANQFATSLSTLEGALKHRVELIEYQREFYRSAKFEAAADPVKMYALVGTPAGSGVGEFLARHGIRTEQRVRSVGASDEPGSDGLSALCVPAAQPQYRLLKSLFEKRTVFESDEFYDVSAWRLPSAYGLHCIEIDEHALGAWRRVEEASTPAASALPDSGGDHGWVIPALDPRAVAVLAHLAAHDVLVRLHPGAGDDPHILVHPHGQRVDDEALREIVAAAPGPLAPPATRSAAAGASRTDFFGGFDPGSPRCRPIVMPKPLLVVGPGVSPYEAGEAWFVMDHRHGIPVSMVETGQLASVDFGDYSHVVMVNGSYGSIDEKAASELKRWIRAGGILFAQKSAATWAAEHVLAAKKPKEEKKKADDEEKPKRLPYAGREGVRARKRIPGTVFTATIDRSHPLGWGFPRDELHMFKNSTTVMPLSEDPFANVVVYDAEPHLCGYAPDDATRSIAGTAAVIAERVGRGVLVRTADDVCFRAYWRGTERLLINTLLFAGLIDRTAGAEEEDLEDHGHAHGAAKDQ